MAQLRLWVLLLPLAIIFANTSSSLNIYTVHHIVPMVSNCSIGRECIGVATLLNNTERYFTSNTKLIFQPGIYVIDATINKSIVIYNVNDLVITTSSSPSTGEEQINLKAMFHCLAHFNIIIVQGENVHISNIDFLRCGATIHLQDHLNKNIFNHLRRSDNYRKRMWKNQFNLQTFFPGTTHFATIYMLDCVNVTVENTTIVKPLKSISLLTVNIYGHFNVTGCLIEASYRVWYIDNYINPTVEGIFHKIRSSRFVSRRSGEKHEATVAIIVRQQSHSSIPVYLEMNNTTIRGEAWAEDNIILGMLIITKESFHINLNKFHTTKGKQSIITGYLGDTPSTIDITDAQLEEGSSLSLLTIDFLPFNRRARLENIVISDAVESLQIQNFNVQIQNITVTKSILSNPPIYFRSCSSVLFEGYNKISLCRSTENFNSKLHAFDIQSGGIFSAGSNVTFRGETIFESNTGDRCGALEASAESTLIFEGKILFIENVAYNGGAISLSGNSVIKINQTASIMFIRNHAQNYGGAIFNDKENTRTGIPQCFYEPVEWDSSINYKVLNFVNNTAVQAGDSIYSPNGEYASCNFRSNEKSNSNFKLQLFINILESYPSNISAFASPARRMCFCSNSRPNCTYVTDTRVYYPGQEFNVILVAVGIGFGTVPATVQARTINPVQTTVDSGSHLSNLQTRQETTKYCSQLNYTIHSNPGNQLLLLTAYDITFPNALYHIQNFETNPSWYGPIFDEIYEVPLLITVTLESCPAGFQLSQWTLTCICHSNLTESDIGCDINDQTVKRKRSHWIMAVANDFSNESDIVIHKHCPYDYCKPEDMNIRLDNPDNQCSNQRSGVLCGQCQHNLSMLLGTTRCRECSHYWLFLIFPLSIIAGMILVVILTVLNLTVTTGTINGLILYANIVQTNKAVLFPSLHINNINNLIQFTKAFVAWLNLDFGLEVCFYNGFDTYSKALFQLAFPLYIWTIMIFIIISSHYFTRIARITGRNAVQVLATLFLLSYSKVLRVIITALSVTSLNYPYESKLVWLQDGNVDYLRGKHAFLFILALILLMALSIPYTSILIFSQCLQRWSNYRVISWIWKVKPLFDAYTGPFKDKHRYWTGLLLLVRVVLYTVYSTNVGGDPSVNILATCITIACLLTYLVLTGGVYKSWPLTILECSYLLNLMTLMAVTQYSLSTGDNQDKYTSVSTMIVFLTVIGTLMYHIYMKIKECPRVKNYIRRREQNLRRIELEREEQVELQEAPKKENTSVTSQVLYFDKILNEPLLEECQP